MRLKTAVRLVESFGNDSLPGKQTSRMRPKARIKKEGGIPADLKSKAENCKAGEAGKIGE